MSLGEGESDLPVASWRMLARKNVLAGLLFIAVGALGLWLSRDYPIGTALRMGTGYVPRLLCWLLLGLGAVVLVQGLREAQDARPLSSADIWALRPVIFVTASLVIFGLSIERLGLVVSILLLIGVARHGARLRPRRAPGRRRDAKRLCCLRARETVVEERFAIRTRRGRRRGGT